MDTKELRRWIIDNNVEERTIKGFWYYLKTYQIEEPDDKLFKDYDLNLLNIKLEKVALIVNFYFDNDVEYVTAYLTINYFDEEIGMYKYIFTLNGETADDMLKIY